MWDITLLEPSPPSARKREEPAAKRWKGERNEVERSLGRVIPHIVPVNILSVLFI